jgi:acyl-coenzyme A thioesterase PaaI-like protein
MSSEPDNVTPPAVTPPAVRPEPDWVPCRPFPEIAGESFVSGHAASHRMRIAYFKRPGDEALLGRVWFGPETQGPPGFAHGGALSAVLDEALGAVAWASGYPVVVARLTVDFRRMVALGTDATLETRVKQVIGRKVMTSGRLLAPEGDVLAEGEAICVLIGDEHFEKFRASQRR